MGSVLAADFLSAIVFLNNGWFESSFALILFLESVINTSLFQKIIETINELNLRRYIKILQILL